MMLTMKSSPAVCSSRTAYVTPQRSAAILPQPRFFGTKLPQRADRERPQQKSRLAVEARQSSAQDRAVKGAKKAAEGDAYGNQDGGGNAATYLAIAIASAVNAGVLGLAPETASDILFLNGGGPYQTILCRILALGFLGAATSNWTQNAAAKANVLDDDVHRRVDGSLSFFAAANLFITAITFVPNPALYPSTPLTAVGAGYLGVSALAQWWVAGRNYAKYSPEGANPVAIIKSYVSDLSKLGQVDGLNSTIYSVLTAAFVGAGFAYLLAPVQTLDLIFGTAAPKSTADIYLWQLIGGGVATVIAPIAYTQKEAAVENNFSRPDKRALMAGLASASIAHTLILVPLLGTANSGPGTVPLLGTWALSALASTFIAIKPSE